MLFRRLRAALLLYRAASLQGRGELEKVIDTAERILRLDPASRPAFFLLAENCFHIRSYARAERTLEEALRHHPGTAHFHVLLAKVREKMGRPPESYLPHLRSYLEAQEEAKWQAGEASVRAEAMKGREALHAWAEEVLRREDEPPEALR